MTESSEPARAERHARQQAAPPPLIADRPSIAVLPFENLSEDRALELIANGLAEDIIALLARVPGFFVIARASSFLYARQTPEVRQIGDGARRPLRRHRQRAQLGERVRITVQLVEAESGNQLWAGRYDVERGNTLDLQDEIARRIIVELEPALTKAELSVVRRRRTDSVDAWSHYRQAAGAIAVQGWNEESVAEALQQLAPGDRHRPGFCAGARAARAAQRLRRDPVAGAGYRGRGTNAREEAERAVAIDPNASDVLGFAGCALADVGDMSAACELLRRAVELDPSNAQAHVALGAALIRLGRFDDGIKSMQFGMRSSPKDFRLTFWSMILADALRRAGRLEEALASPRRPRGATAGSTARAWFPPACCSGSTGPKKRAARWSDARRIRPALSLDEIERFFGSRAAPNWRRSGTDGHWTIGGTYRRIRRDFDVQFRFENCSSTPTGASCGAAPNLSRWSRRCSICWSIWCKTATAWSARTI